MTHHSTALAPAATADEPIPYTLTGRPLALSPVREADIRERATVATPGPWGFYDDGTGRYDIAAELQDTGHGYTCRRQIAQTVEEPIDNDSAHRDWTDDQHEQQVFFDGDFIGHARTDVPVLLAEIDRLRAELEARPSRTELLYEAADTLGRVGHRAASWILRDEATRTTDGPRLMRCYCPRWACGHCHHDVCEDCSNCCSCRCSEVPEERATERLLTAENLPQVDAWIDDAGVFAKQFTESVDGRLTVTGLRIGEKPGHVVAKFGDTIVRHADGSHSVRSATAAAKAGVQA